MYVHCIKYCRILGILRWRRKNGHDHDNRQALAAYMSEELKSMKDDLFFIARAFDRHYSKKDIAHLKQIQYLRKLLKNRETVLKILLPHPESNQIKSQSHPRYGYRGWD